MEKDVIRLESSYWDAQGFKESIEEIKSLIVELLCNTETSYDADAKKIGACLFYLDLMVQHDIRDNK